MIYSTAAILSFLSLSTPIDASDIGNGVWRTFGHETALPLTSEEAIAQKWIEISKCDPNLGILYAQDRSGPSDKHPLGLRFTAAGKIAGVQATIYGSNKFGDAAQKNLIDRGYWKPTPNATKTWHMDVSFRSPEDMCSKTSRSEELIGDRVVINQDTIKHNIPLTASSAMQDNWTCGSCIETMGWHHFYDLKSAPKQSYEEDQLVPLIAMYHPSSNNLNAFFFTTPVAQPGSGPKYLLTGAADWESPDLGPRGMCLNWCDDACTWETPEWSTMHIYLSSDWQTLTCPNADAIGRSCEP